MSKFFSFLYSHLSFSCEINLISYQKKLNGLLIIVSYIIVPMLAFFKWLSIRHIVNENNSMTVFVIVRCHGSKFFLSSSVPKLNLDIEVLETDIFWIEVSSDCRLGIKIELVFAVPEQDVGLSHSWISNQNDLDHKLDIFIKRKWTHNYFKNFNLNILVS